MKQQYRRIHFIGIGGIGMSAIAQMLLKLGYEVSGSDIKPNPLSRQLEALGARVFYGHSAANALGADCVVYSSSIDSANPELSMARLNKIPVKHRSQMLAFLSADKWTAAVSGTHGKSTTTSLLGCVYHEAGKNPTVLVGAKVDQFGGNFLMGDGPVMIMEADESDASFLEYNPNAIIVTNIDTDHLDHFKNLENITATFKTFIGRLETGGRWYGCAENAEVKRLLAECPNGVSYGFNRSADYAAGEVELLGDKGSRFLLYKGGDALGEIRLSIFGRHNVLNAVGVCALALDQGLTFEQVRGAIRAYRGASRRFDLKLSSDDLIVVDDYAHHPTEIRATLEAAKGFSARRLVVVFQPHRYSRTQLLEKDFAPAFDLADDVVVTDIYAAGEKPIEGVTGRLLAERISAGRRSPAQYMPRENLAATLAQHLRKGDFLITMGAGDIGEAANEMKKTHELKPAAF